MTRACIALLMSRRSRPVGLPERGRYASGEDGLKLPRLGHRIGAGFEPGRAGTAL